jgi:8-oxo-dGTP pyrophosphatase MutT (NUDIX family)/GNAT superfamily N-acetyltransferase
LITYRKADTEDIPSAFDLALRVFMEYEAPVYEPEATTRFRQDVAYNKTATDKWDLIYIAWDGDNIVGVIGDKRGNGHINILFVDGAYHRRGIATELMKRMVCEQKLRGIERITVKASPYGLPFYTYFGFTPTDSEQRKDGFIYTPMEYIPGEIWDIYDSERNKTGRYAERGRDMANGDYHIVVNIWKRNGKGEWLIDRRSPGKDGWPGMWETTGGSAVAGEDSLTSALRETQEELGIALDPQAGTLFRSIAQESADGHTWFQDVWVFRCECDIKDVTFQESETCEAMWATTDKIREMMAAGEFIGEWYSYFDEMVREFDGI